jgi:hypothetical protein
MGQASSVDPPVGVAIVPGEAVDSAAALSLPSSTPTSIPAGAAAGAPTVPPAADVETAEVPPPLVIPDLPILVHEEGAAVVAEVGERRPVTLAEERPETSTAGYPMHRLQGDPTPRPGGAQNCGPPWGAATLSPRSSIPMSGVGSRSCSGAATPWSPSSPSAMSWRSSFEIIPVNILRRR